MAVPTSQLEYAAIDRPVLPYKSYTSPVDESPHFVSGSSNILASVVGYAEKRPGFATPIETALSAIPGTVVRIYSWRRWVTSATNAGAFYVMVCATTQTTSTVWKYQAGKDASFVLLYTDTTTTNPFDFVASANFCFFGNRSTRTNMRKYDGTTCSLWGLDAPTVAPQIALVSGSLPAGLAFNTSTGVISGTPTSTGESSITISVTDSLTATASQTYVLQIYPAAFQWTTPTGPLLIATSGTAYTTTVATAGATGAVTYTVASGTLPTGLSLAGGVISGTPTGTGNSSFALQAADSGGHVVIQGFSIFVNSSALAISPSSLPAGTINTAYSQTITTAGGTAPYTYAIVGGGLPPGVTFSGGILSGTPTAYGAYSIIVQSTDSASNVARILYQWNINPTSLAITSSSIPSASVGQAFSYTVPVSGGTSPYTFAFTSGGLSAQTGYVYGYTYTSVYGHESAMSPLSVNTELFTDQDVENAVIASADPQVNGINLYRTSDGGSQDPSVMRLFTSLTNANQSYDDSTQDVFLGNQTGPALYVNSPPQPLDGFNAATNGRIWGRTGGYAWFTGNEEVTNGIPQECMSNAINGNFYAFPDSVGGLTSTNEGVDIGLDEVFWQVAGQLLSTFQKGTLLSGAGILAPINICVVGNTVFWVDTAKQIFSSSAGEIGEPIRSDLQSIDPMQTFICYHKSKLYNWLVVLDALNGRLFVYDLDLGQWNTPWLVPGMTAIYSGKTAIGQINLIAAYSTGHVLTLTPGTYNDDGNLYGETIISNLVAIVTGRTTSARNHTEVRQTEQFEMEVNNIPQQDGSYLWRTPDYFGGLVDDDPAQTDQADFVDLRPYLEPLQYIDRSIEKRYLSQWRWGCKNSLVPGTRVAFQAQWYPSATPWMMYGFGIAWNTR